MTIDIQNKWQIRAATLSIFLLGFLAGALALNAYQIFSNASPDRLSRQERYERIFNELGLTDAQKAEVQKTVGETRERLERLNQESEPRFKEIRRAADERFRQIMTAEQYARFQQLRDEMRRNGKRAK